MPKRMVDGDALWVSEKLEQVPVEYRGDYAWLLPLAQVNGCFECSPSVVWRECYAARRPDRTIEATAAILTAFESAKMLFRWTVDGKTYGFFPGVQKEGRLPSASERGKYRAPWNTGMVPAKELASFLGVPAKKVSTEFRGVLLEVSRSPRRNSQVGNGIGLSVGSGEGRGLGTGKGKAAVLAEVDDSDTTATPSTPPSTRLSSTNSSSLQNNKTTTLNTFESTDEDEDEDEDELDDGFTQPSTTDNLSNFTAKGLAMAWKALMKENPSSTEIPKNWEYLWEPDFKKLLDELGSASKVVDIMAVSQMEKNRQYYIRPLKLIDNLSMLREMIREKAKAMPIIRKEFRTKLKKLGMAV